MLIPTLQNTRNITDMRENAINLIEDVQKNGLMYLFQRSEPKAVMLSIEEFTRLYEFLEDKFDEIDAAKLQSEPRGEGVPFSQVMKNLQDR